MKLLELIDIFENMCAISKNPETDMLLFEVGTFPFTGQQLFYFSLTRQFPNGEDEFFQLHLDVMYKPNSKNAKFFDSYWDNEIEGNFFDFVRTSEAYINVKDDEIFMIDAHMDEI